MLCCLKVLKLLTIISFTTVPKKLVVALNLVCCSRSIQCLDSLVCFQGCKATEKTSSLCDLGLLLWCDVEEVILERENIFIGYLGQAGH